MFFLPLQKTSIHHARYFCLLVMLICELIINSHQSDLSFPVNKLNRRFKRISRKSSKSQKAPPPPPPQKKQPVAVVTSPNIGKQSRKDPNDNINVGYTAKNVAEVQRILQRRQDDYYGVLNVDKKATIDEVNRAYRNILRLVHTDKNRAPGALAAAQRVNHARDKLVQMLEKQNRESQTKQRFSTPSTAQRPTPPRRPQRPPPTPPSQEDLNDDIPSNSPVTQSISVLSSSRKVLSAEKSSDSSSSNKILYYAAAFMTFVIGIAGYTLLKPKDSQQSCKPQYEHTSSNYDVYPSYDTAEGEDNDERDPGIYSEV